MGFAKVFVALFAIANPLGTLPIYLALTKNRTDSQRKTITVIASIAYISICVVFMLVGKPLLDAFGISIDSFKIAGGLIVLFMGLGMLMESAEGGIMNEAAADEESVTSAAIVPLALPLMAGPGTISTVILMSSNSNINKWVITAAIVALAIIFFFIYLTGPRIARMLGRAGMTVMTKLMGLVLAAMGVQFITSGLAAVFTNWVK